MRDVDRGKPSAAIAPSTEPGPSSASSRGPLPAASLVVPTRNRSQLVVETVHSVLEGEEVPVEIVVIDQSDEPNEALADLRTGLPCDVRYHWLRGSGSSRARNEGIRHAHSAILAFVDDDVRVTRSWYGALVRSLIAAGDRAVVTGRVLPELEDGVGGFVPSTKSDASPAVYAGRVGADVLYPNNMILWRSAIDAVGDFDERFGGGARYPAAEDNDFAFRLLEAGYRIHYVPEAVVYHRAWREAGKYLPLRWDYGRGQGAFYGKHLDLRDRYMLWRLGQELRQRTSRFIRLLPRDPRQAAGQIVCLAGVMTGLTEWLLTGRARS